MSRPTPEERLALVELHLTTDGERWREVVHRKDALRLMQEHAAAEVDAATADLRGHRAQLDCQFAGAYGETDGASHCPADRPCQRCTLERERDGARSEHEVAKSFHDVAVAERNLAQHQARNAEARVVELEAEVERLREALTPSGATKAAYIAEVPDVTWSATKAVLALVRKRAAVAPKATEVGRG